MKRRSLLAAGIVTPAVFAFKPSDRGEAYNDYFAELNAQVQKQGLYKPTMLVDLDIVDKNIEVLKVHLPGYAKLRIVAKSLPSIELLKHTMVQAGTNRLMLFHQPFINAVASQLPHADVLLGKPMPVTAAKNFYQQLDQLSNFKPTKQLQWLVDSKHRLEQYQQLAYELKQPMQINIEIDVGLHRGGVANMDEFADMLAMIAEHREYLSFTGLMGYDPHVVKLPSFIKSADKAYAQSQQVYQSYIDYVAQEYPAIDISGLCLNGAGSPSLPMHTAGTVCNDLSAGSCLVKPSDFDTSLLSDFQCAAFIATPVLKKLDGTSIPVLESFKELAAWVNPNIEQSYFIYGGNWMADHHAPKGLQNNGLYGYSSNQQMVNGSKQTNLSVDDFVFLRPKQSEAVFLQFDGLHVFKDGQYHQHWNVM